MEFLKRYWTQIQLQLSQLNQSQMLLIGTLAVLLLVVGFVVLQYVGSPEMVSLARVGADRQPQILSRLESESIISDIKGDQIYVQKEKFQEAMALLAQHDLLTQDTAEAFDRLISQQSPWMTNQQNAQAYQIARNKVLGQTIGKMAGVRSASVLIDMPQQQGFGRTHVTPSASVSVVMMAGKNVDKKLVEAIAGLVAGAVAEMQPQNVTIIDANRGQQFTVKSPDELVPSETFAMLQEREQYYFQKIDGMLRRFIPGVVVAINMQIDPVNKKEREEIGYETSESIRSERTMESRREEKVASAEPGVRPNTGIEIPGASRSGSVEEITESETEFGPKNLTSRTRTVEVGHMPKRINVSINVPRSYFVSLYLQDKAADTTPPDDQALQPLVSSELQKIQEQVRPLISTSDGEGVVKAAMIPDISRLMAVMGDGTSQPSGVVGTLLASDWVRPVMLGGLALFSLFIMFGMVRKATQQPTLPTVEELAGVPPTLPGEDDLVGEAEQSEPSLTGVELDEESLRSRTVANQIAELVKANPGEAARLIRRWVQTEE